MQIGGKSKEETETKEETDSAVNVMAHFGKLLLVKLSYHGCHMSACLGASFAISLVFTGNDLPNRRKAIKEHSYLQLVGEV